MKISRAAIKFTVKILGKDYHYDATKLEIEDRVLKVTLLFSGRPNSMIVPLDKVEFIDLIK